MIPISRKKIFFLSTAFIITLSTLIGFTSAYHALAARKSASPSPQSQVDIASLSSKKIGWGQGNHFDDLNRPADAVSAQQQYGSLGAHFVDTSVSPSDQKVIYLTFDEGYENGYSAKILDTLRDKKAPAVFFITGDYAKRQPELVQRMIDEGHTVGNHTWKHYSMPEKSLDICRDEISQLHEYVKEHFGYEMTVFRPPMGEFSEQTLALTQQMGYQTYFWSFAYRDWDAKTVTDRDASLDKLKERLHPGAIYLLHAVSATNADILGEFIDYARSQGYTFVLPK